jgi:hypothetical protein
MNQSISKGARITAIVINILVILFLLFDAIPKALVLKFVVEASAPFGLKEPQLRAIGIILFICTVLYMVPKTKVLGAVLITGYLGGAVMIMMLANAPGTSPLFPTIFGVFVWAPVYLQNLQVRALIPVIKHT